MKWFAGGASLVVYGTLVAACIIRRDLTGCAILFACWLGYLAFDDLSSHLVQTQQNASGTLQQQLRNLYMLVFCWAHGIDTSPLGPLADDPSKTLSAAEAGNLRLLDQWGERVFHHFLASGLSPEQAVDACNSTSNEYARYIAELAPDRIKNRCNRQKLGEPCDNCAKAVQHAKSRFDEILAEEQKRKGPLRPAEYLIRTPPCPTPPTMGPIEAQTLEVQQ